LMNFVDFTGCKLVWDLCALSLRNPDGTWNSTNAQSLLSHVIQHNQSLYGLQLGNEPGHYWTQHFPNGVTAEHLGNDFQTLDTMIQTMFSPEKRPLLFGPDICGPGTMNGTSSCSTEQYFTDILHNTSGVLDGVSIHHYGWYSLSTTSLYIFAWITLFAHRHSKRKLQSRLLLEC
jgi:hypothetical protein